MKTRWAIIGAACLLINIEPMTRVRADEPAAGEEPAATQPQADGENSGEPAGATEEEGGRWQEEAGVWRYVYDDGTYQRNSWKKIGGYWYYFDRDGSMATDWKRIGSNTYCFDETGEMATGWRFNEDTEKWYYFHEDGTPQKGWYQDEEGNWYWFSLRGEMAADTNRSIDGKRYYFLENGQMIANQYIGLNYMDENGQHNAAYDIVIEGKKKASSISDEVKDEITQALEKIPRGWIQSFLNQGWRFVYYPEKSYFSAPDTGDGVYYVYHKLDTSYRKIKFCQPEALIEVFGEYMGYDSGCVSSDSQFYLDLEMNKIGTDDFVNVPDYYYNDTQFYFGKLVEAYLEDDDTREMMGEAAPEVCEILKTVIESKNE